MKVRITDLLDHYHDTCVKLDAPAKKGAIIYMDQFENNQKKSSPLKKILVVAACLVLLLTGVAFFRLAPSIIFLDEEQGGALASPVSIQELEQVSVEEQPAEIYVAELGVIIGADGEEGRLLRLLYNRESLCYTWFMEIDSLKDLLYEASPEGNMTDSLRDEEFQRELTRWMNLFLEEYMAEAYISFSDGSSLLIGGGAASAYEDGTFLEYGSILPEYAGQTPEYLVIRGEEYPLAPADKEIQEAERNRVESRAAIASQIIESHSEETEPAREEAAVVYPEEYPIEFQAEDPDGDGFLTVDLALPVETETASGTVCRFTLDISTGEFRWYYDSRDLGDTLYQLSSEGELGTAMDDQAFASARLGFMNCALETYLAAAYLGFEDGSEIRIGCGDVFGFSDGLFWDGYRIVAAGQDEAELLEGTQVSYLKINDVIYNFT